MTAKKKRQEWKAEEEEDRGGDGRLEERRFTPPFRFTWSFLRAVVEI